MSVFGAYSRYYDLLYRDKDYAGEAEFVAKLIEAHAPDATRLIELGCGTGMHACLLAERGYSVHGLDRSAEMLEAARKRADALAPKLANRLEFSLGNVQCCEGITGPFDVVLSLFHVVSYQAENADLVAMFRSAERLLRPGGLFIFDYWYGPAVVSELPAVRIKRMQSDEIAVVRLAEPVMDINRSLVDVNYQVLIRDKSTDRVDELRETHRMRYLFPTEIDFLCRLTGFTLRQSISATGEEPGAASWGVYSVLQK